MVVATGATGDTNTDEGRKKTIKLLDEVKKSKQQNQTHLAQSFHENMPLAGLILIYVALSLFLAAFVPRTLSLWLSLAGFAVLFAAIGCLVRALSYKSNEKALRTQIEDLDFEIELANYPVPDAEQKSERLFRRSEREVSKYYSMNLAENRIMLYIGVLCILVGFLIVVFTLAMVFFGGQTANFNDWTKGIVAVVGAASGIMVSFIGTIYLKMYAQASQSFGQFHDRLVRTHELFLANMLVTRIAEETPLDKGAGRQALLGELARDIARGAMNVPSSQP